MVNMHCPVCNGKMEVFFEAKQVPALQNVLCETPEEALAIPKIDLTVHHCPECNHLFNERHGDMPAFTPNYNNASASASIEAHLDGLAQSIAEETGRADARIVEIGCGRGELLSKLANHGLTNVKGFDPSAPDSLGGMIEQAYWTFSEEQAKADVVILRHTLEEMEYPAYFVAEVRKLLKPEGKLYVEMTDNAQILSGRDPFALYPEYSNVFSHHSIIQFLAKAKLSIIRSFPVLGGTWLSVWAKPAQALSLPT